jgi:hypothetical protein
VRSADGQDFKLSNHEFRYLQGRVADAGGEMTVREVHVEFGDRVETLCRTVGHRLDGESRHQPGLARYTAAWSDFYYYRAGNPVGHERLDAQRRYA